jgi:hypothetical protein
MASDTFDRESSLRGPVSGAIKEYAAELAKARTKSAKNEVKQKAMEAVKQLLTQL